MRSVKAMNAWVSGSLAGPVPLYCPAPGWPICVQSCGKLRFRSTLLPLPRTSLARPSGFIAGSNHRSIPSGSAMSPRTSSIASPSFSSPWMTPTTRITIPPAVPRWLAVIGLPCTEVPITSSPRKSAGTAIVVGAAVGGTVGGTVDVDVEVEADVDVLVDATEEEVLVAGVAVVVEQPATRACASSKPPMRPRRALTITTVAAS